jgi:penicillin-binding protein 1A
MIGGREKLGDDVFDLSTMARRSPGSVIKPLTVYAPAFDLGLLHPFSPVDDVPVRNVGGRAWPRNSPAGYSGRTYVLHALAVSKNTVSCHVANAVGHQTSFDYGRERFGLSTLVESQTVGNEIKTDIDLSPMALGSLTRGATVRDITGAFAAIANGGVRNKTRTYTHFIDQNGATFENRPDPQIAVKETTAYYLETCLIAAVNNGTGGRARLSDLTKNRIPVAGKTGTTSANHDRWFAGYTPYYTAATWFGYAIGRNMNYYTSNPAVHMWRQVMDIIHADLETKAFEPLADTRTFSFCADSGLPTGNHCHQDPRGGRTRSGRLFADDIPRQTCTVHTPVQRCVASGRLATPYCQLTETIALLSVDRSLPIATAIPDEQYLVRRWGVDDPSHFCPLHTVGGSDTPPYVNGEEDIIEGGETGETGEIAQTPDEGIDVVEDAEPDTD